MRFVHSLTTVFLLSCLWITKINGFMDLTDFNNIIRPLCYSMDDQRNELPNGQDVPIPNTMEAFISLVEKIEYLHHDWAIEDILKALLVSFRYDDLQYIPLKKSFQSRIDKETKAFDILKAAFDNPSRSAKKFIEDDFTKDEKCALYFMISHTVNNTIRDNDEREEQNNKVFIKLPREQGVVTVNSNMKHAFALGKVLLGILAGISSTKSINALVIYKKMMGSALDLAELKDQELNILYTATFGDLIALSAEINDEESQTVLTDLFLPNGWWNDPACPLYYNLATKDGYTLLKPSLVHTTYASIRGAIDGYVLGEIVPEILQSNRNIRLSQILRGYYSNNGISNSNKNSASWCLRQANFRNRRTNLINFGIGYEMVYSAVSSKGIGSPEVIQDSLNSIFDKLYDAEGEILNFITREDSTCGISDVQKCETDSNIFAIMDYKTTEQIQITQRELIGNLTSGMQMSQYGSSVSVFTNYKPFGGGNDLDAIVNTTYSGCSSCAVKYYRSRQSVTETDIQVYRYLNHTMETFERSQEDETGVPAKILLYFNFASPNNEDRYLQEAVNTFRYHHSDVQTMAVGIRKENLKIFVRDENRDIIVPQVSSPEKYKTLQEKICKIPAVFQYKNCYARTESDELNSKYEGFITPGRTQYWAMYPKYFLKSYKITLMFKAISGGQLKVCFSRYYEEIYQKDPKSDKCQETTSLPENTVYFYEKNPCHRYSLDSCRPFYFYIEGKTTSNNANDNPCTDNRCKSPNQIQFEFFHDGISCNRGLGLSCSSSTLFYAVIVSIIWLISFTRC